MVLGRNRVEPSSSQILLQQARRKNKPVISTSPALVHKPTSPHPLGPIEQAQPVSNGFLKNGYVPKRANAVSPSEIPNGRIPIADTAAIEEELSEDPFEDPAEVQSVSKTENSSEKSNATILSAATLDVITAAPRRVGPLFPDTLSTSTKNAEGMIPGLEYLTSIDQLNIKNRPFVLCSLLSCAKAPARGFAVRNLLGQRVFQAEENSSCGCLCCRPAEPDLTLVLKDNQRRQVLRMKKPVRCICHCFPCCLQVITVTSPVSGILGSVHHEWSIANPRLSIKNPQDKTQFFIEGPSCTCVECQRGDVINFPVISQNTGEQVGRISRNLIALTQLSVKTFTPEEDYNVSFSKDLPVAMKAVFLAAVFLLDNMYRDTRLPRKYSQMTESI